MAISFDKSADTSKAPDAAPANNLDTGLDSGISLSDVNFSTGVSASPGHSDPMEPWKSAEPATFRDLEGARVITEMAAFDRMTNLAMRGLLPALEPVEALAISAITAGAIARTTYELGRNGHNVAASAVRDVATRKDELDATYNLAV